MKLKVYAIYDIKVQLFQQPFYMQTNLQAIRGFADLVNDEKSSLNKHPEDYRLFELGDYDEESGTFKNTEQPVLLAEAMEYTKKR